MNQEARQSNDEDLRLSAQLRIRLEQRLDEGLRKGGAKRKDFKSLFESSLSAYSGFIKHALAQVFDLPEARAWFEAEGIEVITWHYKTRHEPDDSADDSSWLSGQVVFESDLAGGRHELEPFPNRKSPYIGIFSDELSREVNGRGGPIFIALLNDKLSGVDGWRDMALTIPLGVTERLKSFQPHPGDKDPLTQKELNEVKKEFPGFINQLVKWMSSVRAKPVVEVKALNNLLASLKVTLKLLKEDKYDRGLPRSTFLCPAYVAGEEVGGMAFACRGVIGRRPALIGEAISTTLLTYLRLREDALAHRIAEDKEMVDQAKRFLLNRFVHDFRHPVESLQSAVKETRNSLTSIEKQLNHVNRMMNETILAFEGRDPKQLLKAKKKPDNVAEFIADIEFFFKKRFDQQGKHLEVVRVADPKWCFNIDRGMLHELLENLIANALEHSGGDKVQLSVERKSGAYLIHVKDNGRGIPAAEREALSGGGLLKRPTTMKGGRVRGRGLVIAKMLAQAHGGDLDIGPGDDVWKTDFVVEIPESKKIGGKDAPKNSLL